MEIDQTGLDAYSFRKKHKVPILDQRLYIYDAHGKNGHRKIETVQGHDSNGDKLSLIVGNHPGSWKVAPSKNRAVNRNFLAAHRGITTRKHSKDYEYGVKE